MHRIDLTDQKLNKWTVLRYTGKNKYGQILYLCQCECGNQVIVVGTTLTRKNPSKSCRKCCFRVSFKTAHGQSRIRNGKRASREYSCWTSMRNRCRPGSKKAHLYHNRGISVCGRWDSFENFLMDMGPRPVGASLDRVDVNSGYSPENCRWATAKEQAGNRRYPTQMEQELRTLRQQLATYEARYGQLEVSIASEA